VVIGATSEGAKAAGTQKKGGKRGRKPTREGGSWKTLVKVVPQGPGLKGRDRWALEWVGGGHCTGLFVRKSAGRRFLLVPGVREKIRNFKREDGGGGAEQLRLITTSQVGSERFEKRGRWGNMWKNL